MQEINVLAFRWQQCLKAAGAYAMLYSLSVLVRGYLNTAGNSRCGCGCTGRLNLPDTPDIEPGGHRVFFILHDVSYMNPCEKILKEMNPAIRAYHTGRWRIHRAAPKTAEDLYREWKKRYGSRDSDRPSRRSDF